MSFESYVRRDPHMQSIVLRDILKILGDKVHQFKNYVYDKAKMRQIFDSLDLHSRVELNKSIEMLIGLLEQIGMLVLGDFRFNLEDIDIKPSPLDYYRIAYEEFYNQQQWADDAERNVEIKQENQTDQQQQS